MPVKDKNKSGLRTRARKLGKSFWQKMQAAWFLWADLNARSLWFSLFVFGFIWVDTLVLFPPGDTLVVLSVLAAPAIWWRTGLSAALGGFAGGLSVFLLASVWGGDALAAAFSWTGFTLESETAREWFRNYGALSIMPGSLLPAGHQIPIILSALARSNPILVAACILAGKLTRYLLISFGVKEGWTFFRFIKEKARKDKAGILGK
jgi:hypothetical protein